MWIAIQDSEQKYLMKQVWKSVNFVLSYYVYLGGSEVGAIKSPNHPDFYPGNITQCWVGTPRGGYAVSLEFEFFDVSFNEFLNIPEQTENPCRFFNFNHICKQ